MLLNKSGKKNKRIKAGISVSILCTACLCFSSLASNVPSDKSNVWLTVVQTPTEARISVSVPLAYGFVVIGSVDAEDVGGVSVSEGNLLLPNVLVKVTKPSNQLPEESDGGTYSIQTIAEEALPIKNYSTDVRENEDDEIVDEDAPLVREGIPVQLHPFMVQLSDPNKPEHHWRPSAIVPTIADEDFKKFQMILDGKPFSIPDEKELDLYGNGTTELVNIIKLEELIDLEAPPDVPVNGYTAAGTANYPSVKYPSVDVKIGGRQNQYKQIEESLKVSEIYWEIIPGELPPLAP